LFIKHKNAGDTPGRGDVLDVSLDAPDSSRDKLVPRTDIEVEDIEVVVASRPRQEAVRDTASPVDGAQPGLSGLRIKKKPVEMAEAVAAPVEPTVAQESPEGKGRSLLSALKKRKPTKADTEGEDAAVSAPKESFSLKGLLRRKDKVSESAAPQEEPASTVTPDEDSGSRHDSAVVDNDMAEVPPQDQKAPDAPKKPKKKERKAKNTRGPAEPLDILIEFEANRRVLWRVGANSLTEIGPDEASAVASFSGEDLRFPADAPLSFSQARDLAVGEVGEEVRIVNRSKEFQTVYATTVSRVDSLSPLRVGPGLALLEQLSLAEHTPGEDLICGFVLTGERQSLTILYHFLASGEVSEVQVTANTDDFSFVLSQFAASHRLDANDTKVLLYKNAELLEIAHSLETYPLERAWGGVPVSKAIWGAACLSLVAAVTAGSYAAYSFTEASLAKGELKAVNAELAKMSDETDTRIRQSIASFARTQSMDLRRVTERAGQAWSPRATITLEAATKTESYTVTLPLIKQAGLLGGKPSVLARLTEAEVTPLLNKTPSEGCVKNPPQMPGGMNAIQLTIKCENSVGALSRYSLD
jgi:hypothetical protein